MELVTKVLTFERMKNNFTSHIIPYYNGLILGFFDKGESELLESDLDIIVDRLRSTGIKHRSGVQMYISYSNFEIIEYASYHILIYHVGKPIRWNDKVYKRGLYNALNEYVLIIEYSLNNYIRSFSELADCFRLSKRYEEDIVAYLNQTVIIFGPSMFDKKGDIYSRMCNDMVYRAYRAACLQLNHGFNDNKSILLPSMKLVTIEKNKLIRRMTRYKYLSCIII